MRNIKCAVNVRAHFNCARPIKWAASKKYKMTKMTKLTGDSFHGTATLKIASDSIPIDLAVKLAPPLKPINFNPRAQLEFKDELTGDPENRRVRKRDAEKNNHPLRSSVSSAVVNLFYHDPLIQNKLKSLKEQGEKYIYNFEFDFKCVIEVR